MPIWVQVGGGGGGGCFFWGGVGQKGGKARREGNIPWFEQLNGKSGLEVDF